MALLNYSSRKFLLVCVAVVLLTVGLFFKLIDATNYVWGLIALVTAYLGANTVQTKLGGK